MLADRLEEIAKYHAACAQDAQATVGVLLDPFDVAWHAANAANIRKAIVILRLIGVVDMLATLPTAKEE
jgi:methyl coenzyme M reductase beta subunit